MRDANLWQGYGTILHYILAKTSNPPVELVYLILNVEDCKGYPLGVYMCTDPDSRGNFPLHIAAAATHIDITMVEKLTKSDPDCLSHSNDQGQIPLELVLRDTVCAVKEKNKILAQTKFNLFFKMRSLYDCYGLHEQRDRVICQVLHETYAYLGSRSYIPCKNSITPEILSNILVEGGCSAEFLLQDVIRLSPKSVFTMSKTRLYPFMTAAVGKNNTLDCVYGLLRQAPHLVNQRTHHLDCKKRKLLPQPQCASKKKDCTVTSTAFVPLKWSENKSFNFLDLSNGAFWQQLV